MTRLGNRAALVPLLVCATLLPLHAQTSEEELIAVAEQAMAHIEAGRFEEAVGVLTPLRELPEAPPQLLSLLGVALVQTGRPADALAVLSPLAAAPDADPAVLYNASLAALELGRLEEAIGYLERSAAASPGSPAERDLAIVRTRQGDCPRAYAPLRRWSSEHPDDGEARLAAAFCAVQLRRAPDAEELLSDLPQDQPRVRLLWGRVLLLKSDPYGALAVLQPILDTPGSGVELDARRAMADAHTMVGESAEAVALLEGFAESPAVALQLGQAQYQSGDLDAALSTLGEPARTALDGSGAGQSSPGLRSALVLEYGRLLVTAGRHQEAIPYLEKATELDPEVKQGWQSLGQALAAIGRPDEAQAALERFRQITQSEVPASMKEIQLEADTEDPTGRELREAFRLLALGRPEEALEIARREAALAPEDPRPLLLESRTLLTLERNEEALAAAETALVVTPEYADAYYQRGVVKMAIGALESAEGDLRRALELSPDHTAAMNDLAVLLMQTERSDEARGLLERVLELRPDDTLAAENLSSLQQDSP